jgi:hypothetical protein
MTQIILMFVVGFAAIFGFGVFLLHWLRRPPGPIFTFLMEKIVFPPLRIAGRLFFIAVWLAVFLAGLYGLVALIHYFWRNS